MKNKNEQQIKFKKPMLVLNNATKVYLATREISDEQADFFFIVSLFMPQVIGKYSPEFQTEISAFRMEDAESADVYRQTLEKYGEFNEKYINDERVSKMIQHFKETPERVLLQQAEVKTR